MSSIFWTFLKIIIISTLVYWLFIEYIDYTPKNKQFLENFSSQVADRILQKLSFHGETKEDIKPVDLEKVNKEREAQILGKNINGIEPEIVEEEKTDAYYSKTKLKTIPNQLPAILENNDNLDYVNSEERERQIYEKWAKKIKQLNKKRNKKYEIGQSTKNIKKQPTFIDNYHQLHKLDDGILYNRNFSMPLSMYQELIISQMTPLISKVVINNHKNTIDIKEEIQQYKKTIDTWKREKSDVFNSKIDKVKKLLLIDINYEIEKSNLTTKYHSYINYQIKDFNLTHQTYSKDKKYINLQGSIHIYRKSRIRYFALHFNIIIPNKNKKNITNNNYYILDLKIIGIKMLPIINKDDKITSTDLTFLRNRSDKSLENKHLKKDPYKAYLITLILNTRSKCFHPKGENGELPNYTNKLDCISYHQEVDGVGVWDEPCSKNEECPFYKANKNYDNQFGGCINGQCQLPVGVDKVGYRHWNKLTQPYCHQCDLVSDKTNTSISDKQCCNQQKEAIEAESISLKSPDYMFENDNDIRNI